MICSQKSSFSGLFFFPTMFTLYIHCKHAYKNNTGRPSSLCLRQKLSNFNCIAMEKT
jgi:hypothetical protein